MSKWKLSYISVGLIVVIVGYSSFVVIIIDVVCKVGVSDDMVVSWLLVFGFGMGIICILFLWLFKLFVVIVWFIFGVVFLLISIGDYCLSEVIGVFILCVLFFFVIV